MSGVIALIPRHLASLRICRPVSVAATPSIELNFRRSFAALAGSSGLDRRHRVADRRRTRASPALHDHAEHRVGLRRRGVEQALRDDRAAAASRSARLADVARQRQRERHERERQRQRGLRAPPSGPQCARRWSATQTSSARHISILRRRRIPSGPIKRVAAAHGERRTIRTVGAGRRHSSPFWGAATRCGSRLGWDLRALGTASMRQSPCGVLQRQDRCPEVRQEGVAKRYFLE